MDTVWFEWLVKLSLSYLVRWTSAWFLTGRLSTVHLVVSADGKSQTLWNCSLSPTLLSLTEFILLVSIKGLSLHKSFLSKHFIFRKGVFFFFACCLTTSEGKHAAEKWLPSWQTQSLISSISTFFLINLWGQADPQH